MKVICHRKSLKDPKKPHNTEMVFTFSGESEWGWGEGYECPICGNSVFIITRGKGMIRAETQIENLSLRRTRI